MNYEQSTNNCKFNRFGTSLSDQHSWFRVAITFVCQFISPFPWRLLNFFLFTVDRKRTCWTMWLVVLHNSFINLFFSIPYEFLSLLLISDHITFHLRTAVTSPPHPRPFAVLPGPIGIGPLNISRSSWEFDLLLVASLV